MRAKIVARRRRHRRGRSATSPTSSSPSSSARRHRRHHQLRRAGVVQAVARERAAHQRARREERARPARASSARGWCTCRPATSPASATARCGRTSRRRLLPAHEAIARDCGDDDELLDRDFDPAAEIADCQSMIDQVRERPNDRAAHLGVPRARAPSAARRSAATPTTRTTSRSPSQRERKIWLNDVADRSSAWSARSTGAGPTRTRTRSRSASRSSCSDRTTCASTIVRPGDRRERAALSVPGLERGLQHDRAAVFLMLKGHRSSARGRRHGARHHPGRHGRRRAASRRPRRCSPGEHEPVYQLGSSDVNPLSCKRARSS